MVLRNPAAKLVIGQRCLRGHMMTEENFSRMVGGRTACRDCAKQLRMGETISSRVVNTSRMPVPEELDTPRRRISLPKLRFMGEV